MSIDPTIFRAYDIRGKVPGQINVEVAGALGLAFGTYIAGAEGAQVAVGRDNRSWSEELQQTLLRALVSTGCAVYDIGLSTSPALYFAVGHWGLAGGVSGSGRHNPPHENGFKLGGAG